MVIIAYPKYEGVETDFEFQYKLVSYLREIESEPEEEEVEID